MMRIILLAFLFIATAILTDARAQAVNLEPIDSIAAVVEEDVILRSELDRAAANILNQYANRSEALPPREVLERQVLERLILMRLQLQHAEASGVRVSDTELERAIQQLAQQNNVTLDQMREQLQREGLDFNEFRQSLREELIVQRLRQRIAQSRVTVSDTELEIALASESLKQGQVHVAHVLVAIPDGATPEQVETAKTKIDGIRKLIGEGMEFNAAAIRYSDAPNALEGGDLGWRSYDEVPALFANTVQGMKPGEVSQPIHGPSGYHLIKLLEQRASAGPQTVTEYHARGILVRATELVAAAQARERIDQARARIASGEDFAKVAKDVSDDTLTRDQGGDMGWFQMYAYGSAVGDQIKQLKDGELSQPFRSDAGWHLIERLGSREQDVTEDLRRNQARETIARRKAEEEYERFLRQLRSESYIDIRSPEPQPAAG